MNSAAHYYLAGMGSTADYAVQTATNVAEKYVPTAIGPTVAGILGISTTIAIPIVGAAIAGISIAIEAILHSGCGQTCIITSEWANQAAAQLTNNLESYLAIPAPRPKSVQQIALANFQAIWNQLVQLCSQPDLGSAGQRCISDRQEGACHYKPNGQCWNWFIGYRDPIANDPHVYDDTALSASNIGSSLSSLLPAGVSPMLMLGIAALGLALLVSV